MAKEKLLAEKEAELARFSSEYSAKIGSLDVRTDIFVWGALLICLQSQMRQGNTAKSSPPSWRHLVGKRPVATCTNIVGFSMVSSVTVVYFRLLPMPQIPDEISSSDEDEELQTGAEGDAVPRLTSLLADILIQSATVGMLAEALAKVLQVQSQATHPGAARSKRKTHEPPVESFTDAQRRTNKVCYFLTEVTLLMTCQANVQELFYTTFHFAKDDEYMLHVTASHEAISSFMHEAGTGPDPLELHWDMTTTHNSKWNQKVIDILCSQYTSMFEKNQWASRSRQSIIRDITKKFNQCRNSWRKAQPRMLNDGTRETMREVENRLVDQTNERLRLTRVLTRRATVSRLLLCLEKLKNVELLSRSSKLVRKLRWPC
jgi:hypothetical protein